MEYNELLFDNGKINNNKLKKEWIEKNIPEYFIKLSIFENNLLFTIDKYSQLLYHYENKLISYPKCDYCENDNKRFIGYMSGYKLGCSGHCAILLSRSNSNKTRIKNTIEKYGVDHTSKLISVKDKMKDTNIKKYGGIAPACNIDIVNKIKNTNIKRYGTELPLQNNDIKLKMVSNFINKWGVDNPSKSNEIKNKKIKNSIDKYGVQYHITLNDVKNKIKETTEYKFFEKIKNNYNTENIIINSYNDGKVNLFCNKCNKYSEISSNLLHQRFFKHKLDICLNCNPLNNKTSKGHLEIVEYLKEIGVDNIILNNRKIISPYEIDIYLPDYKIGIEFNGVYWHSEFIKDKKYHNNKTIMCNNLGIELMQIWEDDWYYKCDIIKSIIKNRLKKNEIIIGARKCDIREVSNKESKIFLDENHIQGWSVSKWRFGLYHNNILVSLITFGKGRKNVNSIGEQYELIRFCNKLNYSVVGSLSRLWGKFIKLENPNKIISYCDLDIFNGNGYLSLGMKLDSVSINYTWCDGRIRWNRWNFRKDKLVTQGYDSSKTEVDIMTNRGWWRCWGSGNNKYIYYGTTI